MRYSPQDLRKFRHICGIITFFFFFRNVFKLLNLFKFYFIKNLKIIFVFIFFLKKNRNISGKRKKGFFSKKVFSTFFESFSTTKIPIIYQITPIPQLAKLKRNYEIWSYLWVPSNIIFFFYYHEKLTLWQILRCKPYSDITNVWDDFLKIWSC